MSRIIYKLNGYNLNELGIIVKSADGLIDLPELKKRKECDWADMHGKIIDTRRPYFEPRTITLDCAWPIEPRGRNLLINSYIAAARRGDSTALLPAQTGWSSSFVSANDVALMLVAGETYTISFDYEVTAIQSGKEFVQKWAGFGLYSQNDRWVAQLWDTQGLNTVGAKAHFSKTFTVSALPADTVMNIYTQRYSDGTNQTIVFSNLKIEKGNKATDWTPAPEDIGIDVATEGGTFNIQTAEEMVREKLLLLGELVRLEVHFDSKILVKPLIFNVIQDKGITFGRKFSGADVLLTFKITLIEPQPCKIVLESKKTRGSYTRATSSIGFTPNGAVFDVDWGDGSTIYDIGSGSTLPITHAYSGDGTFYVIISGDVAAITNLTKSNDFAELWTLK